VKTVAIFGGGMAGLSAAHELAHRGYKVHVYEKAGIIGGKSASQEPSDLCTGAVSKPQPTPLPKNDPLPGEHGFRFFPGFYHNIIATMDEIPNVTGTGSVTQDLVPSRNAGISYLDKFIPFPRQSTLPPWDVFGRINDMAKKMDFSPLDLSLMAWFRIKYLTSGPLRRRSYDAKSWKDFIELDKQPYSAEFKDFEISIPRTMSAMAVETTSAKIVGDIAMQFGLGYARPGNEEDRLLVGPTHKRWLEPWYDYLDNLADFEFHENRVLDKLHYTPGSFEISKATVLGPSGAEDVNADYYIAALPIEKMRGIVNNTPDLAVDDPEISKLVDKGAPTATSWMVGAQFYLKEDVPMVDGHVFYPKSPWALTSVSQGQFWKLSGNPIEGSFGDGNVKGIISAIISDWETPGGSGIPPAKDFKDRCALLEAVRQQLEGNTDTSKFDLSKGNVLHAHLDENMKLDPAVNETPLLIHPLNGLDFRPKAYGKIENLFLAADYVLTSTGLATMEGANEAARLAVNELLTRVDTRGPRCAIASSTGDSHREGEDEREGAGTKRHCANGAKRGPHGSIDDASRPIRSGIGGG